MLVQLSGSNHVLADPEQDIRGRQVLDHEGKDIGEIDDLLIDPEHSTVQLLRVEHDGLFGVGAGPLYIPADCVGSVTAAEVRLDRTRVQVAGAPTGDEDFTELYEYYASMT